MALFKNIQISAPKLNKFDLSHERKMSMKMADLVPVLVQDVIPGEKWRVNSEVFARLAPIIFPMMHRCNVTTHYFFVPNRLLWNEWEDFITGGEDGMALPGFPKIRLDGLTYNWTMPGSLFDYLGVPELTAPPTNPQLISALPFRAYQMIYNEYYRDQNVTEKIPFSLGGGDVTDSDFAALVSMRKRAWEKDYFTSALPFAQRGPEVKMPIEGEATVGYKPITDIRKADGTYLAGTLQSSAAGELEIGAPGLGPVGRIENIENVQMDNATTTINDLRIAVKLQEWFEKAARGGSRYIEQMLVFFGVRSSDARLQRPEYLGGGQQPLVISEVLSTFQAPDDTGLPQGNMSGRGIVVGKTNGFSRTFEEHGIIIGLISVLPKPAYQQGLPRFFKKFDKFAFYWKEFANIGEQEVKNEELYWTGDTAQNEGTFGYQSRYAEYKYCPSTVHGEFKTSMAYAHMGRIFTSPPALNTAFIQADPTDRIYSVTDASSAQLYCQIYNRVSALRPMPYFGTPTL